MLESLHPLIPSLVPATSHSHLHTVIHSHLYFLSTPEPLFWMAPLIGALFRPIEKGTALGSHPISFWATAAPLLNRHWYCPIPSV